MIQYSRWFFASPGSKDTLIVRLTKGNTTVELERIDINTPGKSAWVDKSFRLLDYMTKGKKIKLSFYVRDKNADHVIECGVDNFMVYENFLPVVSTHKVVTNNNDLIVKAYPNPLTDVLNIKLNQSGAFTFEIRDITGRLIMSNIIDSKSGIYELDCSLLNKGMYLLHISNQNTNAVLNIVKH